MDETDPLADNFAVYSGIPVNAIPDINSVGVHDFIPLDFSVFPNPVYSELMIHLEEVPDRDAVLEIFNAQGQRVLQQRNLDGQMRIDFSDFSGGIYFLKIASKNKIGYKSIIK